MRRADFLRGAIAASATANAATEPARGQAPTTDTRAPRRALILSGGGSRGVYQAAVAVALARGAGLKDGEALPYDLICGTSIGALNGYLIATAQYRRLEEVWSRIPSLSVGTLKRPYDKIRDSSAGIANRLAAAIKLGRGITTDLRGVLSTDAVRSLLDANMQPSDQVHIPLYISATNLTRSRAEIFVRRATTAPGLIRQQIDDQLLAGYTRTVVRPATDEILRKALFASAAVPLAFDPVGIPPEGGGAEEAFVDGGVTQNVPIAIARHCARTLHVILVDPVKESLELGSANLAQIGLGTFQTMQRSILEHQVRLAYVESARANEDALHIAVIRPGRELPGAFSRFNDADALSSAWQIGYRDGSNGWTAFDPPELTT